jgi:hypothetical protein
MQIKKMKVFEVRHAGLAQMLQLRWQLLARLQKRLSFYVLMSIV